MKKIIFPIFSFLLVFPALSQKLNHLPGNLEIGFRVAPHLSFTKVDAESFAYPDAKSTGVGVRFSTGFIADYFVLKKKIPVAISSGIWYTTRAANAIPGENYNGLYSKGRYNLSYVQIPFSAKVYIFKLNRDTKLYLQPGLTLDVKVSEKARDADFNYFYLLTTGFTQESLDKKVYRPFNLSPFFGVGAEKTLDRNTKLFGSISLSGGLLQILSNIQDKKDNGELVFVNKDLRVYTSQLSFEVGIKF